MVFLENRFVAILPADVAALAMRAKSTSNKNGTNVIH
jgi:hypothetical protein